jgi:glycosyltransferase involved in cell wall biosynthesis
MAAGKPVVATAIPSSLEVLKEGVTGLIVPSKSPESLAGALVRLVKDRDLRNSLGTAAYSVFTERYTEARMTRAYLREYMTLLREKGLLSATEKGNSRRKSSDLP